MDGLVSATAGKDCCLDADITIRVNFLFINVDLLSNLTAPNGSLRGWLTGITYQDVKAHELAHVRGFSTRIKELVDGYNKKERPCFKSFKDAVDAAEKKKGDIEKDVERAYKIEASHAQDGHGSPR
jgi:hypothetical protein